MPRVSNLGGRFGAKNICGGWADGISGLEQGKCQPGRHWHRSSLQLASVSSASSGAGGRSEGAAFGAVQIGAGTVHRRGTPPAVVEMNTDTWLALATGILPWENAVNGKKINATGVGSDLTAYLPVFSS